MEIILANKAGFCFGVKRAVDEAINVKEKYDKKIYTLGPLIHNKDVVNHLKKNDVYPIDLEDVSELRSGDVVIIRSHGVTPQILKTLSDKGITIVNATCPYVSNIQQKVKEYFNKGYSIVIVGDKSHPEVIGINGWCDNKAIIAKSGAELEILSKKVCVVSQTTEKQANWESVLNYIVKNCKEIVAFNTICNATEVRQREAEELSKNVDAMIVLGGFNSSNTTKLYDICRQNCANTIHVENFSQIPDNFIKHKNIKKIGITAGASTPDWIIEEVITNMNNENNLDVNEQLEYMKENEVAISVGQIVKGTIISLNEKEAYVDLGTKSEGYISKEEITTDENIKLTELLNIGDEIEAKVIRRKNEDGYIVLSRVEIERENAYKEIKAAYDNKTALIVTVSEAVTGGLVARYKGVRVFVPASHVELFHVEDLNQYVKKELEVNIIEYKEERKGTKIVASRREILKNEKIAKEEETWASLQSGEKVTGEVKRLTDFGAFIDINGVDGLLHVSEISWGRINKPSDVLKIGDKIEVYILEADKENKKLSLSIKKLIENPWTNVEEKYPAGNIVLGKVVRFASFGAFVELEPGVDGLVHISQISNKRINKPEDVLKVGELIKAKIIEVDKDAKKIGLSIKEVEDF
ncbi:bifunctional 4-hydroxy-3-methylbut-2-enyl diphosphate reductase/30S ribosomal protein S1 [Clostridium sp. SYSU_GA19001]|uniref:bifunctional 4-hydroxy-3-methylbut-2-enyl diphosphate reductase/30S ribosomal protein S1 n=1 Tax=Clostridium caldaquaticum TaxID=2940653 RepID=UPI0020775121|nr:bifunctional 4-hydroxy-3-methylbut-2-enyl diphosphate reductase/30S ribosomal protein S1 [Clostridium caldaquaticum]MCM8710663.1 bifunctional 4-hydroxy-3-methylbut-2-enyl diphosphate reductase/30S ribosomal protein S1 [Clostridium caldaquaticum]